MGWQEVAMYQRKLRDMTWRQMRNVAIVSIVDTLFTVALRIVSACINCADAVILLGRKAGLLAAPHPGAPKTIAEHPVF
jgi:hypothetical protein